MNDHTLLKSSFARELGMPKADNGGLGLLSIHRHRLIFWLTVAVVSWLGSSALFASEDDDEVAASTKREVLAFVPSAADQDRVSFVRIFNRENREGQVTISARDDAGNRPDPITLDLEAEATTTFDANDLEQGNDEKGIDTGIGSGEGAWRLELESELDLLALVFVRTTTGAINSLSSIDRGTTDLPDGSCFVPYFHASEDDDPESSLRLDNFSDSDALVEIVGHDDDGETASDGAIEITLAAGTAQTITASELVSGADGFSGSLGEGSGSWRLNVSADQPVSVVNLIENPDSQLVRISSCAATRPMGDPIVFVEDINEADAWGTDPVTLNSVSIEQDTLIVSVSYSGGCEDHEFTLLAAEAFMETDPVQLRMSIAHNGNGDLCEAWLTEELRFDLSLIAKMFESNYQQKHGQVVLMLDDAPGDDLVYDF